MSMFEGIRFDIILDYMPMLLKVGVVTTIKLTTIAVGIGTFLGLIISLIKLSRIKIVSILGSIYVDFFRGTPLLVQIFLIHFAILPAIIPFRFDPIVSGIVALTLNSAAYIAEIFRAGISSIDRGQMEAARSLGMTHGQAMRYIIVPQAFKRVVPALGNEFIAMLKDSSLVSVISVQELAMTGSLMASRTFRTYEAWITVAILYLIMTMVLSQFVAYLERRLGKSDIRS